MLTAVIQSQVSEREFLSLPESLDRIELVDGEVLLSPSPTLEHQSTVLALATLFQAWAKEHPPALVGLSPLDVRLQPNRIVQPDLSLFLRSPPAGAPIDAVPDLVVEVLSTNRAYDRITKRLLYAEAGVKEYWVVDPEAKAIEQIAGLKTLSVRTDLLASDVAQGLSVQVPLLFKTR